MQTLPISSEQKRLFALGRVPLLRRRFLPRTHLSDHLYFCLKKFLTDPDSEWFLVCGMVGSGKSELLTKILWERPELSFVLVDRVLWVTDRHSHPAELEHLVADTLLLADSLSPLTTHNSKMCDFLCSQSAGKSIGLSAMAQSLKALLLDQTKTLLVLDGVQMVDTVKFFNQIKGPNCKILATSSSRALFEGLENVKAFAMPFDGCSGDELAQMAQNYGITTEFSSEQINAVLRRTGGNLALLEKMFVMARGNLAIFDSLLAQLQHFPLSVVSCHSAYHNFSLEKSFRLCFEILDDTLGRSFDCCTVIEPFCWTNFEIFPLIWPLDVCGSESDDEIRAIVFQQLSTLEANSLLDKNAMNANFSECSDQFSDFWFRLHPLVHNFLLHCRPNAFVPFNVAHRMLIHKLRHRTDVPLGRSRIYADYLAKNEQRLKTIQINIDQKDFQQKRIAEQRLADERNQSNGLAFEGTNCSDGGGPRLVGWTTQTIGRWVRKVMGRSERK